MKIIETRPREIGFVLWDHCQNLLDDPRKTKSFNSQNNKNVSSIVEHRINRVAFCNKRVWGTPWGYVVQPYAK